MLEAQPLSTQAVNAGTVRAPWAVSDFWDTMYRAGAIFVRDARLAVAYPASFWLQWLNIIVSITMAFFLSRLFGSSPKFGFHGAQSYFFFLTVNLAFVRFQQTALMSFAQGIRDAQTAGTLEVILATPTRLPIIVLSAGLWAFGFTALQTAVYLAIAVLFGLDLQHANVIVAAIFIALTVTCLSTVGVMAAAAVMTFKQVGPLDFLMAGATNLFGGVYFPLSMLPVPLQVIGWMLPITHALSGIRGALHGDTLTQLMPEFIWLSVATVILLPVSLVIFGSAVRRAKIDGTLGQY
jgi:ABC-2 type transport system permease protein